MPAWHAHNQNVCRGCSSWRILCVLEVAVRKNVNSVDLNDNSLNTWHLFGVLMQSRERWRPHLERPRAPSLSQATQEFQNRRRTKFCDGRWRCAKLHVKYPCTSTHLLHAMFGLNQLSSTYDTCMKFVRDLPAAVSDRRGAASAGGGPPQVRPRPSLERGCGLHLAGRFALPGP